MKIFISIVLTLFSINLIAQMAITMPAEYEKNEGVIMTWPYSPDFDSTIAEISGYVATSGDVWLIYNPDSMLTDTNDIRNFLEATGNNHDNIYFTQGYSNTFFVREYGPVFGYGVFDQALVRYIGDPLFEDYNRPADDSIPAQLANLWQTDYVQYSLAFESGNILIDGEKNGFVSDVILEENMPLTEEEIKQQLSEILNISNITILDAPEHSGGGSMKSIDMFMKLLDPETILFTEIPDTLPDYNVIENNVSVVSNMTNVFGSPYEVVRIKAAPLDDGGYDTTLNGELRSYTNALVLNDLILIPSYNNPEYDSAAIDIYRANTYGMHIKMIDARALSQLHAAIHTITREKPQEHFLRIRHKKVEGSTEYYGNEYTINCLATGDDIIDSMWLYYRFNSDTAFLQTTVHLVCPSYYAVIENVAQTDTIHYYLDATLVNGTTITYPLSAPDGFFSFWFDITGTEVWSQMDNKSTIFPNPVNDYFIVKGNNKEFEYEITDAGGRLLDSGHGFSNSKIEVKQSLSPGIYFLLLRAKQRVESLKFVKL